MVRVACMHGADCATFEQDLRLEADALPLFGNAMHRDVLVCNEVGERFRMCKCRGC